MSGTYLPTGPSIYETLKDKELYPVGFPVLINRHADPKLKAGKSIATRMKMVDLIPVGFILNYKAMADGAINAMNANWLQYEFDFYIMEYRKKLMNLNIPDYNDTYGVRLWTTGASSGSDEVQNQFTENSISGLIKNNIQNSKFGELHQAARSFGYGNMFGGFSSGTSKGSRMLMNLLFEGRHVSLPQVWQESTYSNNYMFTVKLSSPYGSLEAIKRFIAEPLMRILALVSSSSNDGITYGLPPYLYVRAYGITYMRLGIPTSIQITRGNEDRINKYKQPLDIVITLQINTAIPGFAALIPPSLTVGNIISGNPGNSGILEDIDLDDLSEVPKSWDDFGSSGNAFIDILRNSKSGPAVNTLGSVLKSLLPAPPDLASSNFYDMPALNDASFIEDLLRKAANGSVNIPLNNNAAVEKAAAFAPTFS